MAEIYTLITPLQGTGQTPHTTVSILTNVPKLRESYWRATGHPGGHQTDRSSLQGKSVLNRVNKAQTLANLFTI